MGRQFDKFARCMYIEYSNMCVSEHQTKQMKLQIQSKKKCGEDLIHKISEYITQYSLSFAHGNVTQ